MSPRGRVGPGCNSPKTLSGENAFEISDLHPFEFFDPTGFLARESRTNKCQHLCQMGA
jgi:hypothetical protein